MSVSKKLSLTQLIFTGISFILTIVLLIQAFNSNDFKVGDLFAFSGIGIVNILISLGIFGVAIAQIVLKVREQTSGVYLAAGICGIIGVIPFLGLFGLVSLAALILNIIGLCIRS